MALVKGTNCGFVSAAPTLNPSGAGQVTVNTRAFALKDIGPAGATRVSEIGWWCDNATTEAETYVGIFDNDEENNRPGNLLGSVNFAKGTAKGWKKASVNIDIVEGETYWIATQLDNTATGTKIDTAGTAGEQRDYKYDQGDLPAAWGASTGTGAYLISLYAVVGAGTNMKINIGDSFKDVAELKINIGGVWKDVIGVKINIGNVWRDVF